MRAFVATKIRTIGHMEALALVFEEGGAWSTAALASRLYLSDERGREIVRDLVRAELFQESPDGVELRQTPPGAVHPLVEATVRTYRQRLLPMTALIHAQTDAGRQIAAAFRFRRG